MESSPHTRHFANYFPRASLSPKITPRRGELKLHLWVKLLDHDHITGQRRSWNTPRSLHASAELLCGYSGWGRLGLRIDWKQCREEVAAA